MGTGMSIGVNNGNEIGTNFDWHGNGIEMWRSGKAASHSRTLYSTLKAKTKDLTSKDKDSILKAKDSASAFYENSLRRNKARYNKLRRTIALKLLKQERCQLCYKASLASWTFASIKDCIRRCMRQTAVGLYGLTAVVERRRWHHDGRDANKTHRDVDVQ